MYRAIKAEFLKNRYARILWVTLIAFGLAPLMGAVFMLILRDPDALAKAGALHAKSEAMGFANTWDSYFGILNQAIGVGGVMVFGFVASWIFGREYSDGTAKDLLALPTSRTQIINAKFVVYVIWSILLIISNLLIAWILGTAIGIEPFHDRSLQEWFREITVTSALTIAIGTPIAFFALWGKGYLAPLGFVALTLVLSQIVAATGYGTYFPWSVPGLFSGAGGEYKELLNFWSYFILILVSVAGYAGTILYWRIADQSK